jgi:hypothetical protein
MKGGTGLREAGGGLHGVRGAAADLGVPVAETVEKHADTPDGGRGTGSSAENRRMNNLHKSSNVLSHFGSVPVPFLAYVKKVLQLE